MRLTVAGATGGIGRQVCAQALAAGHEVTALVRDPRASVEATRMVVTDLTDPDPAALRSAVAGADAVLSALGPRAPVDVGVVSRGTRALVDAMTAAGTRRLVVVSAAPIGTVASPGRPNPPRHDPGDGLLMRLVLSPTTKAVFRRRYADLAEMEDVLRRSDLDWTAVRPPRLTDGPRTGSYRTAVDRNLHAGLSVSRADVADLLLAVAARPDTIAHTVGVAR